MEHIIAITEYLYKEVTIDAPTEQEAIAEAERRYRTEKIVLTADDYSHTDIVSCNDSTTFHR